MYRLPLRRFYDVALERIPITSNCEALWILLILRMLVSAKGFPVFRDMR